MLHSFVREKSAGIVVQTCLRVPWHKAELPLGLCRAIHPMLRIFRLVNVTKLFRLLGFSI